MTEYQTFFKKLMETYITKGKPGEGMSKLGVTAGL